MEFTIFETTKKDKNFIKILKMRNFLLVRVSDKLTINKNVTK